MQIKLLQYAFYILMCLPILVLGFYFFLRLGGDIKAIKAEDKREQMEKEEELEKRRLFEERYSKRNNG